MELDEIILKIKGSLEIILDYAQMSPEDTETMKGLMDSYANCSDRASSDDEIRLLRRNITKMFYTVYKKCFFRTLDDTNIPAPVLMFMYFGYMDERVAGAENAILLYRLSQIFMPDPEGHIFTFYSWLKEIYYGKRAPSVNEMSLDYPLYVKQLRAEGKVNDAQVQALLSDNKKKVEFEINNVFFSAGKITSGQVTIFCPVFSDHQLYKPLDKTLVSYNAVYDCINKVRQIDYSCFYREQVYSNPDIGISKEYVQTEVLPDVILLPNVGVRGAMWQEISERKRTTPARFILPFFSNESIEKPLVRMCGEFRWELCKRVQGARWNDLSDPSLTADYCNYIETFRKNRDLSAEQKEKLKSDYRKYRNSIKEMFVADYINYVMFESQGSLRINKVSRNILFSYCPFRKNIRAELGKNGMYTKLVERHAQKYAHALHISDMVFQKINNAGKEIPYEIREHRMYLES